VWAHAELSLHTFTHNQHPGKIGGNEVTLAKRIHPLPFITAPGKPPYRPPEEPGTINGITFEERECNRQERAAIPGMSNAGQRQINNRLAELANESKGPEPSEVRMAFALAKLLREVLQPADQRALVKALTDGSIIERKDDVLLFLASETIRALPREQWDSVFSLLDQGARR
jgi:hypothetical protein